MEDLRNLYKDYTDYCKTYDVKKHSEYDKKKEKTLYRKWLYQCNKTTQNLIGKRKDIPMAKVEEWDLVPDGDQVYRFVNSAVEDLSQTNEKLSWR